MVMGRGKDRAMFSGSNGKRRIDRSGIVGIGRPVPGRASRDKLSAVVFVGPSACRSRKDGRPLRLFSSPGVRRVSVVGQAPDNVVTDTRYTSDLHTGSASILRLWETERTGFHPFLLEQPDVPCRKLITHNTRHEI